MTTITPRTPDRFTCEDMFRRLDRFLDRTLTADEQRLVREHLELCASCASEYRFEESLLDELRVKLGRIEGPSDLMARISAAIAAAGDRDDED